MCLNLTKDLKTERKLSHFSKYRFSFPQEEKIKEKEAEIAGLEEERHRRIARHLGTNFVVESYMGPEQQALSSQSLLALSDTLASVSRVNDELVAKEEAMVKLETNLHFELQRLSFNSNDEPLAVSWSQNKAELLSRKQKMVQQLEKELKLSSLRFSSLLAKQQQQQQEVEERQGGRCRLLNPELEVELRKSSVQLARLVGEQQEVESRDFPSNGLNLNQQHLEEIGKEALEQIEVVIESSLASHLLKEEEEISQSSLQLASLMEEESEEGSEEELSSCRVIEENTGGLMTLTGKDSWDWRSGGDDRECGNDAWLLLMDTTGWKVDHSLTHSH